MARNMTTQVVSDCPCGATEVPMAWGSKGDTVKLYQHVTAQAYAGKAARGDKCGGPRDLFSHLLRESGLMLADRGKRVMTRAEEVEHDAFVIEYEDRAGLDHVRRLDL